MTAHSSYKLAETSDLSASISLSSFAGLQPGDVLFYALEKKEVDPAAEITVTFDRPLLQAPVAVTAPNQATNPGEAHVRLVVICDPDTTADHLPGEGDIPSITASLTPITLEFAPSSSTPREIKVIPASNLKAGVTYELRFDNIANNAERMIPAGETLAGRFTVKSGEIVGQAGYSDLHEIVRRGSILYEAIGAAGVDILDVSDPTRPLRLGPGHEPCEPQGTASPSDPVCPTMYTMTPARSVAIAENVLVPEGPNQTQTARTMLAVAGGNASSGGRIDIYYADPQDEVDGQPYDIGTFAGGAALYPRGEDPKGIGNIVRTMGTTAYVATIGIGLEQVDLNQIAARNRDAVVNTVSEYKIGENNKWDITGAIMGLATFPARPQANPATPGFVIGAIQARGMAAWTEGAMVPAGVAPWRSNLQPSWSMRMAAYPDYAYTVLESGQQAPRTTQLLLLAGGTPQTGLMVYELSPGGSSLTMTLRTVIPLKSSAYDVALDTRRHIAYVACYDSGVAVVDMSDPYRCDHDHPYSKLDANGDGIDDRVLGYVQVSGGSRATLVVDSETGLLYIGDAGTTSGLKIVGQQKPRMEFLLQDSTGQFQAPGYLSAFDGDKPRLGVWLPGGAGQTLTAQLELYDRKGMPEQPQVIGQNPDGSDALAPMTSVYRAVTLTRQSQKRTEAKYNFYIQNNTTPDAVELGMLYDPAAPNLALMVTKQGGTLRALATPPAWHNTEINGHAITWGLNLRLDKTVSRPWVEWTNDQLVEPQEQTLNQPLTGKEAAATNSPASGQPLTVSSVPSWVDLGGPAFFGAGQEREITYHYSDILAGLNDEIQHNFPAQVNIAFSDPALGTITPASLAVSGPNVSGLRFKVKGTAESPSGQQSKMRVTVTYANGRSKVIDEFGVSVFDAGLAVDYNRDGTVSFDQAGTPGLDHVPDGKYYEFWLNDNYDASVAIDNPEDPTGQGMDEDDKDIRYVQKVNPKTGGTYDDTDHPEPDYTYDQLRLRRDLTDFTRLILKKVPAMGKGTSKIQYAFYFDNGSTGNPGAKLFRAKLPGEEYLHDNDAAGQLLGATVAATVQRSSPNGDRTILAPDSLWGDRNATFLMEGTSQGKGGLALELRYEGVVLGKYYLAMDLKPVTDMYEQYTVGDTNGGAPETDCSAGCPDPASPFRYETPQTDQDKDYFLFVHGWNWNKAKKIHYASWAFKEVYWLGYKGRFGAFRWPGMTVDATGPHFDQSEYRALESGAGLENVIRALAGKGYRVHLVAHSQGAMVSGEALRRIAGGYSSKDGAPKFLQSYILAQAAVPVDMYIPAPEVPPLAPGSTDNSRTRPDLYGRFPEDGLPPPNYRPYFEKVPWVCGQMINFYNNVDYAVGRPVDRTNTDLPEDQWLVRWLAGHDEHYLGPCASLQYYGGWFMMAHCIKPAWNSLFYSYGFFPMNWIPATQDYRKSLDANGEVVGDKYECAGEELQLVTYPNLTDPQHPFLPPEDERYRAMAFETQTYSYALGATAGLTVGQGGPFSQEFNLRDGTLFNLPNPVDAVREVYHGGQFRGATSRANRTAFWKAVLGNLGLGYQCPRW